MAINKQKKEYEVTGLQYSARHPRPGFSGKQFNPSLPSHWTQLCIGDVTEGSERDRSP